VQLARVGMRVIYAGRTGVERDAGTGVGKGREGRGRCTCRVEGCDCGSGVVKVGFRALMFVLVVGGLGDGGSHVAIEAGCEWLDMVSACGCSCFHKMLL
jgi:hypothetical protein